MKESQKLPTEIGNALDRLSQAYSDSPATTGAGRWLRILVKIIPLGTLLKMVVHKAK